MSFSIGVPEAEHDDVLHPMKGKQRGIQSRFLPPAMKGCFRGRALAVPWKKHMVSLSFSSSVITMYTVTHCTNSERVDASVNSIVQ